jgi:hypothetical protein
MVPVALIVGIVVCKSGIFSHHISSVEKVCISLELLMINYSSKKYMKENTSLNCRVLFSLLVKNHLFQKSS